MKTINVAVMSIGFIGKVHTYAYRSIPFYYDNLPFKVHLKTVYNRTLSKAVAAAEQYGFENATDNPDDVFADETIDVVNICSANDVHKEFILKAIKAKKHIYCEKPITILYTDAGGGGCGGGEVGVHQPDGFP